VNYEQAKYSSIHEATTTPRGTWENRFSQLGYPSQLDLTEGWQVYVNGKPFTGDFHTIPLQAHTLITLAYNSPGVRPDTNYNWNGL